MRLYVAGPNHETILFAVACYLAKLNVEQPQSNAGLMTGSQVEVRLLDPKGHVNRRERHHLHLHGRTLRRAALRWRHHHCPAAGVPG